jgi:hypothetical protein
MRHSVLAIVVIAVLGLLPGPAVAGTKILSGTYTKDQVLTDCANAGGVPFSGGPGGAFGCNASGGSVVCSKAGKCSGTCSNCQQRVSGGIKGILQPPNSAGAARLTGSSGGKGTTKVGVTPPASAGAKQEPSGGSTGHPVIEKQSGSGGKH